LSKSRQADRLLDRVGRHQHDQGERLAAWPNGTHRHVVKAGKATGKPRGLCRGCGAQFPRTTPTGEPYGAESTGRVPVGLRRLHDRGGDAVRRPGPRWAAREPGCGHGRRGHTGPCRPRQRPCRRREVARAQKDRPHRGRWNARERATGPGLAWAGIGSRPPDRAGSLAWPPGLARSRARSPGKGRRRCVPPSHGSCATPRPRAMSATLVSHARGSGAARAAPAWSPSRQRGGTAPGRSWPVSGARGTWLSGSHSL
jgi:hypothetical protein